MSAVESEYKKLENSFDVVSSGVYRRLVTANGNSEAPIHRWFRMKEAYSHELLGAVLNDQGLGSKDHLSIIDPFSGSGTTAVSAGDWVRRGNAGSVVVRAAEANPFLRFVSTTKLLGLQPDHGDLALLAGTVARRAMAQMDGLVPIPTLSTFENSTYFSAESLTRLRALKASTDVVVDANSSTASLLRLAIAAAVEPSSHLRRDGRALRYVRGKIAVDPISNFLSTVREIVEDIAGTPTRIDAEVAFGDSREVVWDEGNADVAVFSPPYPNNIDYTEIYKLEAWFLGFLTSAESMKAQRRKSLRSHNSLRWANEYGFASKEFAGEIERLLEPLLQAIPSDHYAQGRRQVVLGYFDDMLKCFVELNRGLKPGGSIVFAVGNSHHGSAEGGYVIASDLLLARLSELAGFRVEKIDVARYPNRRATNSAFLRESVVFARKPQ